MISLMGPAGSDARAQAVIGGEWRGDVARVARRLVEMRLTPGVAVGISVGDWVAYADGFGAADASTGRPVTGDTPFYIASSTKSLTGLAATLAAAAGKIDLSSPMVRYLPRATLPDGVGRNGITVHDLAAMTHGLAGNGPIVFRTAYTGVFTQEQLLELLQYHRPTGKHGTFEYGNIGYNLLGMVLEAAYGRPWQEVVDQLVIEPVGMRSTTARVSQLAPDRIGEPHVMTAEGFERIRLAKADANMHAAGGHFASARDLARYVAAHASGGIIEGTRVLPESAIRATHRQQAHQSRRFGPFMRHGWAYGWDLGTYDGDTLIHRFGAFEGYRSHMSFMPQRGIGVVVLVNGSQSASPAADLLATYIYDRLRGKPEAEARVRAAIDSLSSRAVTARADLARHLEERRARLAPLRHPLEAFAGRYENPRLGRMEWRVVAGGLEMRMGVAHTRAEVYDAPKNQLRVEVTGSGDVAEFVFPSSGGDATAVRLTGHDFTRIAVP